LDEFKVLGEYEVYCSIQKPKQQKKLNVKGKCVLTKNPCMHPADLRVVNCVSDEEIQKRLKEKGKDPLLFEGILNVIVFPQQGKTPLTMEISQSDLDGDEFFLSWDQRIVPYKNLPPFVIAEKVDFKERPWTKAGYEEMLDFCV
jgi:RNA-dependent RNA polymerase